MFQDVDSIIYGIMFNFIVSAVINKMMFGFSSSMLAMIVTDDGKEVMFPAEASIIEGFDLEGECIHIAPPEGLLDIYLGGDEQA